MALEKVRELPITGFSANRVELVEIPSDQAIKELRFDVRLTDASGGWTVTSDPFNLVFQYIELLFDGDKQYRIDSMAKLQSVSLLTTGRKAEVEVMDDTESGSLIEAVNLRFKLPVYWTSGIGVQKPQIRFQYVNTSGLTSALMRIQYVHTADTSNFTRFKYDAVPQTASDGGTLQFKPDNGAVVRGAFIYVKDASKTYNAGNSLSLGQLGGDIGLDEITLTHDGVEYWSDATERDLLHHMYDVFPLIPRVGQSDAVDSELGNDVASPFRYVFVSEAMGGDAIPADAGASGDLSGLNAFLWMSFEDITANVNTVLKTKSSANNHASGDEVEVYWVYSTKANEKAK